LKNGSVKSFKSLKSEPCRIEKYGESMDIFRLGGMALAVVGLIILLISRLSAWELGLFLGIIVILAGFGIYAVGLYRVDKKKS
jgi:hypothetical protein